MTKLKTSVNEASVLDFLNAVSNEQRQKDAFTVLEIFKEITKKKHPKCGDQGLEQIDLEVLKELIAAAYAYMKEKYA